ncbi:class I lanthipeptide [Chitinophaga qingshengii]|uniref:Class I lanthipeptide n=1 Tax=Chitinophaga qingshengii TaxID=1569794 RepID=A0ABR7TSS3_9BACT|nr:class I lanthipeptide [Chitinophaga qingshengii]MBC9933526.1 class I lanthipeptide [Chitinophaga qingshengii]
MKKVKVGAEKKLLLGKIKIAALSDEKQAGVVGGATLPSDCMCSTQAIICNTRTTCQTARC